MDLLPEENESRLTSLKTVRLGGSPLDCVWTCGLFSLIAMVALSGLMHLINKPRFFFNF